MTKCLCFDLFRARLTAEDGFWYVIDVQEQLMARNRQASDFFGRRTKVVHLDDLGAASPDSDRMHDAISRALKSGELQRLNVEIKDLKGNQYTMRTAMAPFHCVHGRPFVLQEVTPPR